jgi:hypothetical protein
MNIVEQELIWNEGIENIGKEEKQRNRMEE